MLGREDQPSGSPEMQMLKRLLKDESGATAIEYGLIAALVSVVIIGVLGTVGDNLLATFTDIGDALDPAAPPAP
jgi:pilus assembly protein Flp/PilA